jgi:hypothetical protein
LTRKLLAGYAAGKHAHSGACIGPYREEGVMSYLCARKSPRQGDRKRQQPCLTAEYAEQAVEVITTELHRIADSAIQLSHERIEGCLMTALRNACLFDCTIQIENGEVHAFFGQLGDRDHGHAIVPIKSKLVRYFRPYGVPRGRWNIVAPVAA